MAMAPCPDDLGRVELVEGVEQEDGSLVYAWDGEDWYASPGGWRPATTEEMA